MIKKIISFFFGNQKRLIATSIVAYLFVFIFLRITNVQLVNDFLNIQVFSNIQGIFDIVIGSLASISGIVIAVMLLSFQLLNEKLGVNAQRHFFGNKYLISSIFLFTTTIVTAFISKFTVSSNINHNDLNIIYLTGFMFLICLTLLLPLSIYSLFSLNIESIIKKEIDRIDIETIIEFASIPYYATGFNVNEVILPNPFNTLRDIGVSNIAKGEINAPKALTRELSIKYIEVISKSNLYKIKIEDIEIFTSYLHVMKDMKNEAIKNNNFQVLKSINIDLWFVFSKITEFNININLQDLIPLKQFIIEYFEDTINNRLDDIAFDLLNKYERIIVLLYEKYLPKEESIDQLYFIYEHSKAPKGHPISGDNWHHLEDYIESYRSLFHKIIDSKNENIFISFSMSLRSVVSELLELPNLGKYQKQHIAFHSNLELPYLIKSAYEKGLAKDKIRLSHSTVIDHWYVEKLIHSEVEVNYLKRILQNIGDFMIEIYELDSLTWSDFNDFGALGHLCLDNVDKKIAKEGFLYIIKVFDYLRKNMEDGLVKNKENYSSIKEKIEWYKEKSNSIDDNKIKNEINRIWQEFKPIPNSNWIKGHGYVEWEETLILQPLKETAKPSIHVKETIIASKKFKK